MRNDQSTFIEELGYLIDTFDELQDMRWSETLDMAEYRELRLKKNDGLPIDQNRLEELEPRFKNKIVTAARWNKFQNALIGMQTFIKTEVEDFVRGMQDEVEDFVYEKIQLINTMISDGEISINSAKDSALISIENKKDNIIEYMDGTTAGAIRNDIGVMGDLATDNKSSLVNAINEVNAKEVDLTPLESMINNLGEDLDDLGQELESHLVEFDVLDNKVASLFADFTTFKNNIEAIDFEGDKLLLKVDGEWIEFKGKDGYPVGNVADLSIAVGNGEATIKWQDPPNTTIKDSLNNEIAISKWAGSKLVRKVGSYPVNENDGTLVVDSITRDKYKTNGYRDTGLANGTTYYYMIFPYTEEGVVTIDSANRISGTPQAYDDLTGSPGPKNLIAGDMQEGFFGEVSAGDLITGVNLASQVGISQGTSQYSDVGWLKFAYQGKILFVAKKPIRHSISWDAINSAKCVHGDSGDKTVVIGGLTYKVRLFRGGKPDNDPKVLSSAYSEAFNHGSEWNRLMCQIHEQAINKNWDYSNNVEANIGILTHSLGNGSQGMYNDADLLTRNTHGNGSYSWCQEIVNNTSGRLSRGCDGVSGSYGYSSSDTGTNFGWRPVLELVP